MSVSKQSETQKGNRSRLDGELQRRPVIFVAISRAIRKLDERSTRLESCNSGTCRQSSSEADDRVCVCLCVVPST